MKKSLKFTIETQTENNEILAMCHLNEKQVALDHSRFARKMFKLNKDLFNKLNKSTTLNGGVIYRQVVVKKQNYLNKLMVMVDANYENLEEEIVKVNLSGDFLKKQSRIKISSGALVDYDPENLEINNLLTSVDPMNLTNDDIINSHKVSDFEEISLFQDVGVRSFILKDYMQDTTGINEVSYRMEISVETKFEEHIKYVLEQLSKSITFITNYVNSIRLAGNYNGVTMQFKPEYSNSVLKQLGLSGVSSANIGSDRVKNSEFGTAALAFYNASILLRPTVNKSIYGKIIRSLLPTSLTSANAMERLLSNFSNLYTSVIKSYDVGNDKYSRNNRQMKISSIKKPLLNKLTAKSRSYRMDQSVLGYNIFSEQQSGLNKMSSKKYRDRFVREQAKYYPSIEVADESGFMTSKEKSDFSKLDNAPSFLTPANLLMGNKKITTSRGMNNINIEDVRMFRIAKSARASQIRKSNFKNGLLGSFSLSKNVMSEFNLTIGPPKKTLLTRASDQEIDPLVDAKHYVGSRSFFVTDNPSSIFRAFRRIENLEDQKIFAIVSDVIPARFLRHPGSIETIKDLQFSNKKSKIRSIVAEKSLSLSDIPPQIKSMMSKNFQPNPNIDPLHNKESRAIIEETQKNIFLVRAHTGFEKDPNGFPDLNRPIMEDVSQATLSGKQFMAKAYNYEVPELGIVKDKFMPTIYNNLLYVRG